jgi:DNA-binding response OmpR family regulator
VKKILLIEDNFDVQTMLRDALAEAGYEVGRSRTETPRSRRSDGPRPWS